MSFIHLLRVSPFCVSWLSSAARFTGGPLNQYGGDHDRLCAGGVRVLDLCEKPVRGSLHHQSGPVVQRAQPDVGEPGVDDIVEAQQGDVIGNGDMEFPGGGHHAQGDGVAGSEDGRLPEGIQEKLPCQMIPHLHGGGEGTVGKSPHGHAQPVRSGGKPPLPGQMGVVVLPGAQIRHLGMPKPEEVLGGHFAAGGAVHIDGGNSELGIVQPALEDNGDVFEIAADQLRRLFGGAGQNDAVYPVPDQEVEELPDVAVLHPPPAKEEMVTPHAEKPLQRQGHIGEEGVVQVGQDAAHQIGSPGAESAGQQIPAVAILPAQVQDFVPQLRRHRGRSIQHPGDRGAGDAGDSGDVFDCDSAHKAPHPLYKTVA